MIHKQFKKKISLMALFILILSLTGCMQSSTVEPLSVEHSQNSGIGSSLGVHFENVGIDNLNMENSLKIIRELTSEKYAGRMSGTDGNKKTVEYIADYYEEIGLKNPEGLKSYLQPYTQKVILNEGTPIIRIEDEQGNVIKEFEFSLDYRIGTFWEGLKIQGSTTAELTLINDINEITPGNESLEAKILLIENSVINDNPKDVYHLLQKVLRMNIEVGGIIVNLDNRNCDSYVVSTSLAFVDQKGVDVFDNDRGPIVAYCNDMAFDELKNAASKNYNVYMEVNYRYHDAENHNVIGTISGNGVEEKNEYILIGAHLDHVGDNQNDTYQPGAFDNASGTATIMEIARVLKETEIELKKSIVFIAFNGEEQGLFGSTHYVNNPIYPMKNSVLINLDMVGSKNVIPLTIGGNRQAFNNQLYELAQELGIECEISNDTVSDQLPFNKAGVDAVTLIHNDRSKIHTTYDTMDNIDMDRMKQVAEFVLYYIDQNAY